MNWYNAGLAKAETFFNQDSEGEPTNLGQTAILEFSSLFKKTMKQAKIREDWDTPMCYLLSRATICLHRSPKMRTEFKLGIASDGWFIECPIDNSSYIRYMKDEFWGLLRNLNNIGSAELHDYGRPYNWGKSDKEKKLLQHSVSLVYAVARDYTMLELSENSEDQTCVGGIRVSLPLDSSEEQILEFYTKGLPAMYRLNYLLYRQGYQTQSHDKRKLKT